MFKFVKSFVAVSLACGMTVAANAENISEIVINSQGVRTVLVTYDDLDLTTAAGQERLSHRIEAAARRVCGVGNGRVRLQESQAYSTCTTRAMQNAIASLQTGSRTQVAVNF